MRLHNKAVIITGSTTGIGKATARRFVAEGASVLLHGRELEHGEQLSRELGDKTAFHADDLADPSSAERIVRAALRAFGRIDAVVNNAAIVPRSDIHSTTRELFDRTMAVNVAAPLAIIQAAFAQLSANRGCVVNIGSVNGYCGEASFLAYSISKGALMTMSRNLADSLAGQVRVNHLNVGWTLTENEYQAKLNEGAPANWPELLPRATAPSGRLISPDEIAAAALYWASDESYPISGGVVELEQYPMIGRNPIKETKS